MPTFVALLRGINVGKAKRVPMARLRELLAGLGYEDIRTLLNSGNAVFRADAGTPAGHASRIAEALLKGFSFEVPVIVKSAEELAAIVAENPIDADESEHPRFLVVFTQEREALEGLSAVHSLVVAPERFAIGQNAAYLHCARGILESKAGEALVGKGGKPITTRNLATTLKLHAMVGGADS